MRKWSVILVVACGLLVSAAPVWARSSTSWFFGFNLGVPVAPYYAVPWSYGVPSSYPVVAPPVIIQPPPVYVQPAPVYTPPAPAVAPTWSYCGNPQGYYPYIQQCPGGWQAVPATPQ